MAGTQFTASISDLKTEVISSPSTADIYYITDAGKEGEFHYVDVAPSGTTGDDALVIISSTNRYRYRRIVNDHVSVKWFGALGDGSNDDHDAIQSAIDTVIKDTTLPRIVYFPKGTYRIRRPLICANFNTLTNKYAFFTINLVGENTGGSVKFAGSSSATRIFYDELDTPSTDKSNFAIGFHLGKSGGVKGLMIQGEFLPPTQKPSGAMTQLEFYRSSFDDFDDPTCSSNRYAPYAGIVVDPFRNGGTTPTGGGYTELATYYTQGTGTGDELTSGSSGLVFEDLAIYNFSVGAIISPNGQTQNADSLTFKDIQVGSCRAAFVSCQDQQKQTVFSNIICWDNVHTVFKNTEFGIGTYGNGFVQGVDVAGTVNRLLDIDNGGYYPWIIKDVFAESLGTIGTFRGSLAQSLENSVIEFFNSTQPDYHGNFYRVNLRNVSLRRYGTFQPLKFTGNFTVFSNCYFETEPLTLETTGIGYGGIIFDKCHTSAGVIGGQGDYTGYRATYPYMSVIGDFAISDYANHVQVDYSLRYEKERHYQFYIYVTTASITPDANREATFNVGNFPISSLAVNDWFWLPGVLFTDVDAQQFLGRIKSINSGANTVTIELIPPCITGTTSYGIYLFKPRRTVPMFRGTPTPNGDTITDCVVHGNYNPQAGMVYDARVRVINVDGYGECQFMIKDFTGTTATIVGTFPSNVSGRHTFYNGNPVHQVSVREAAYESIGSLTVSLFVLAGSAIYNIAQKSMGQYRALTDGWLSHLSGLDLTDVARLLWIPGASYATVSANKTDWQALESNIYYVDASAGNLSFGFLDSQFNAIGIYYYDINLRGRTIKFIRDDSSSNTVTFNSGTNNTINGASSHVMTGNVIELYFGDDGKITILNEYYSSKQLLSYTSDSEASAYTGASDGEAKLADLNALRLAYENLRTMTEDLRTKLLDTGILYE